MGAAGCAAAAALIWIAVAFSASARWLDVAADHGFFDLQRPALVPIANAVSHSMDPAVLVLAGIALVAVALVRGRPRVAAAVPVILIGANVTTQLLKPALAYPRGWATARSPTGHGPAATRRRPWPSPFAPCSWRRSGCGRRLRPSGRCT